MDIYLQVWEALRKYPSTEDRTYIGNSVVISRTKNVYIAKNMADVTSQLKSSFSKGFPGYERIETDVYKSKNGSNDVIIIGEHVYRLAPGWRKFSYREFLKELKAHEDFCSSCSVELKKISYARGGLRKLKKVGELGNSPFL